MFPFASTFKLSFSQHGKNILCKNEKLAKLLTQKKFYFSPRVQTVPKNMGFLKRSKRKKMGDTSSHIALGPVLLLAQFFAVMPLYGITARSANNLKFTYFNLRTFHTVIIITGNMVMVILSILWAASNQLTISVFGNHFLIDVWIDYRKESKFTSKWFCFQFAIARLLWSRKMLNDFFITLYFFSVQSRLYGFQRNA